MADTSWVSKTAILAAVLAIPAISLLVSVWRERRISPDANAGTATVGLAVAFLVVYAAWFLNTLFELSAGVMVGFPVIGSLLAIGGCAASIAGRRQGKRRLTLAFALLLVLSLSSVVAPN